MIFGSRNRRNDGEDLRITLIESPTIPTVGVGEATTVSMQLVMDLLALDEKDFVRECDASLTCAVRFDHWDRAPDGSWSSYFHPFEAPIIFMAIRPPIFITAACAAASGWIRWPMPCCR